MLARIAGLFFAVWLTQATIAAPPVERFTGEQPQKVVLSPSGNYVAILYGTGGKKGVLSVARYEAGRLNVTDTIDMGETPVIDILFKTDDRLLVTVLKEGVELSMTRKAKGKGRANFDRPVVISMPRNGRDGVILMPEAGLGVQVHAELRGDPDHVILQSYAPKGGAIDLHKVNILTGKEERVEIGVSSRSGTTRDNRYSRTIDWSTSPDGVTYLRYDHDDDSNSITVLGRPAGGSWVRLRSYAIVDGQRPVRFLGLASTTSVYAVDRVGGDIRTVWEYDLGTGKALRQVLAPPSGEAASVLIDLYRGSLNGLSFITNGVTRVSYTDKTFAAAQAAIDEALPNYSERLIVDYTRDRSMMVIALQGPAQPPVFYLLDVRRMELMPVAEMQGLKPSDLGQVQTIIYASSDGRQIVAYLSLPPGPARSGLPLIVMPHGGPEIQDSMSFEGWRQFFATRGYAVLQPQFRGSDGFGLAHERAAHGVWGTLVQDDVRFGVAKLVADGIVDPARMCIFGWSYGGYMALAGASFSADLYKCAVSAAGPSDLNAMLSWVGRRYGTDSFSYTYWVARMGDAAQRTAASPANHAAAVKIPVLLVHGDEDFVVPVEQSEIMERALKRAGKTVEFLRYSGQRHSFDLAEEADVLKQIESFIARHLKN